MGDSGPRFGTAKEDRTFIGSFGDAGWRWEAESRSAPSRNSNRVGTLKLDSGRVSRSFSSIPSKGSSFLFLDPLQALSPGVIGFLRALGVPTAIARTLIGAFGTRFSNWGHCPAFCAGDGTRHPASAPGHQQAAHVTLCTRRAECWECRCPPR